MLASRLAANSSDLRLNDRYGDRFRAVATPNLGRYVADMVHAYHVILTAYGCWLPNDPRGSWSEFIGKWELNQYGRTTYGQEFRRLTDLSLEELESREAARKRLAYPPVRFSGKQAREIDNGFATRCKELGYTIWAASILPEHTHLVIARHRYKVEIVAQKLKAASSQRLIDCGLHPLTKFSVSGSRPPRMWSEGVWKSFLDSEQAIEDAMAYVIDNPIKEGKPQQRWSFVTPFPGLEPGWVTYG